MLDLVMALELETHTQIDQESAHLNSQCIERCLDAVHEHLINNPTGWDVFDSEEVPFLDRASLENILL